MPKYLVYIFIPIVFFISSATYAFKIDTHVWVGQQVINDLADDGKLSFYLDGKELKIAIDEDTKNAILNNQSDFLMGNIGPDAAPDVVVGQTVVHPGIEDKFGNNNDWQTNDWLEHLLANTSYSDSAKALVYGYLGHAAADVFAHTYVNQYAGDIFNIEDEMLVEERHFVLESYIGKYTPALKNHLGQNIGAPWQQIVLDDDYANFIRDTLIYDVSAQKEYRKVPTASHLVAYYNYRETIDSLAEDGIWHDIDVAVTRIVAAYFSVELSSDEASQVVNATQKVIDRLNSGADDVQAFTNNVYSRLNKYDDQVFSHLSSAVDRMQDAEGNWLAKHQEWRRKLLDVDNLPNCPKIPGVKCKGSGIFKFCYPVMVRDRVCEAVRNGVRRSNNAILKVAEKLENNALNLKNDFIQKIKDVRTESKSAIDSVHNIANALIDLQQVIGADVSPVQSVLRGWKNDIDLAMTGYVKAASQSMINTMNPAENALDPMVEWFDCFQYMIVGVPSPVANCEFRQSLSQLKESVENIILIIDEATSVGTAVGLPSTRDLIDLRDNVIDDLTDRLKNEVANQIVNILPQEVQRIIELLDQGVDDATLNHFFTKPETVSPAKGLVMIPDMAERVKAEMNITPAGTFDPSSYAVTYNAVVLAKLAILNKYEFEELAIASGSSDYFEYLTNFDNLVAQAFKNIDGNHQWMATPPPLPNTTNVYPGVEHTYSTETGFIPWKDDMRDKLFRKLFIGPLSPGIDSPSLIGKSRIISSEYPYQVCTAYPYPDDIDDKTCIAILLIPILSGLLH